MTINPYTQGHQVVRCIGRFRSVREILKRQRHLRSLRKTTATFATIAKATSVLGRVRHSDTTTPLGRPHSSLHQALLGVLPRVSRFLLATQNARALPKAPGAGYQHS